MVTETSTKELLNSILLKLKQRRVRNILISLYVILVLGLSATAKASDQETAQLFQGAVFQSVEGAVYLHTADEKVFELRAMSFSLEQYVGSVVQIAGYEYKHRGGPVYQTTSFNPLQSDDVNVMQAPVVFVLKIEALQ